MAKTYATFDSSTLSDGNIALSGGDLVATGGSTSWSTVLSTIFKTTGKWYWEYTLTNNTTNSGMGVANENAASGKSPGRDTNSSSWAIECYDGAKWHDNSKSTGYISNPGTGDVIGVAVDCGAGKIWISLNDSWGGSGDPGAGTGEAYSSLTGNVFAKIGHYNSANVCTANFGASSFAGTVPSGFNSGLYTESSSGVKNYYEQPFELAPWVVNHSEQLYTLSPWLVNHYSLPYSDLLIAYYTQWYDDADVISAFYSQYYKDAPAPKNFYTQPYGNALMLIKSWALPYGVATTLSNYSLQQYSILQRFNQRWYEQLYEVKDTNFAINHFLHSYTIAADGAYFSMTTTLTIDGDEVEIIVANCEFSQGSYAGALDVTLAHAEDWMKVDFLQEMILTVGTEEYYFLVSDKDKKENVKGVTLSVTGMSKAFTLDFPYADKVDDTFSLDTAANTTVYLAALEGISLTWDIPVDWPLTADVIQLEGESPLTGMRKIVNAVGGILQSNPDGSMYAAPKYPDDSDKFDTATVGYYLTTGDNFISTETSPDKRDGFNSYFISNVPAGGTYRIEEVVVNPFQKTIKVYQIPWDNTPVYLRTSDLSSVTIARGADVIGEELCEIIEVIAGAATTAKPIYGLVSFEYTGRTNLGDIQYQESGDFTTDTVGESIIKITYTSSYRQWTVTNIETEQVQLILEIDDES